MELEFSSGRKVQMSRDENGRVVIDELMAFVPLGQRHHSAKVLNSSVFAVIP